MTTQGTIPYTDTALAVFDPIEADFAKLAEHNAAAKFDYENPADNKLARSHVFALRKVKARVSDAHKQAKAKALEVCQVLDAKKRDLTARVDAMIEVHDAPLREIEDRERKAAEAKRAEEDRLKAEAEAVRLAAIAAAEAAAEAKLEEIARREAEIARREREEQIAKEATARAEADAKRRHDEAMAIERAKVAADKARRDEELRAQAAEEARRVADVMHRRTVEEEAAADFELIAAGHKGKLTADSAISAIIAGQIRNVRIVY